ncbi:MAG TPA: sigma-70 family RNA polymerase sigma factor [Pyrinomonadaceae bacterium]|nr:sigma-70 family RNA polymerase sigma factor [Pyrinomonadaceae bacterium]
MTPSEIELVTEARRGDAEAFSLLARRFERRIYTLALYYTRDPADAEDLSQEVWLKAYRALPTFRGEASFYTWLRHIMANAFLNHRRDETLRGNESALSLEPADSAGLDEELSEQLKGRERHVEEEYDRRALVEKVFQALGELTPQQRLIFLLKHREGMTYEEIAVSLQCSVGTIKKALFRAVTKLRLQLGVEPAPLEYAGCAVNRNS